VQCDVVMTSLHSEMYCRAFIHVSTGTIIVTIAQNWQSHSRKRSIAIFFGSRCTSRVI